MTSDDFLRRKMEEAEKFDRITRSYSVDTSKEKDLEPVVIYLQEVMEGYLFKRIDRPSFVIEDNGSVIRVTNGYFIVKQTLLYDLRTRMEEKRKLLVNYSCSGCRSRGSFDVMKGSSNIIAFSTDSSQEEDLDLCIEGIARPPLLISLSFKGKLGSIKQRRLLAKGFEILDIYISSESDYADDKYRLHVSTCPVCREVGEGSSEVQLPQEAIPNRAEDQNRETTSGVKSEVPVTEKPVKSEHQKKIYTSISETQIDEGVVLGNIEEDVTATSTLPDEKGDALSNEEFYAIYDKVVSGLSKQIPRGKYAGRSFQWLIAFDFRYLEELLKMHDPEDEVKYYLKSLVDLGRKIGIEQFPELVEIESNFDW